MNDMVAIQAGWRWRLGVALDRAEHLYLRLLRAAVLVVATVMILLAAWLAASGAWKMTRSEESVKTEVASVGAADLVAADLADEAAPTPNKTLVRKPSAALRTEYARRLTSYFALYQSAFERYRQPEDKQLSKDEFDDRYVGSEQRMTAIVDGDLVAKNDLADLDQLIAVMGRAAADPKTVNRLKTYQSAKKIDVAKKVERTRTETRRGWDRYATWCDGWYMAPMGCASVRTVEVPYTETVIVKQFPAGVRSHSQIFSAYHDRYLQLLAERRTAAEAKAEKDRASIVSGQGEGRAWLWTALQLAGAFMVLMFFFLLIAIERHQRAQRLA